MLETSSDPKQQPADLDTALRNLDRIIESMESGDTPLEELLSKYEQGVELVKFCQKRLEAVEQRMEIIQKQLDGTLKSVPADELEQT
jgi:exodeoxyribonuclease VII small subunit